MRPRCSASRTPRSARPTSPTASGPPAAGRARTAAWPSGQAAAGRQDRPWSVSANLLGSGPSRLRGASRHLSRLIGAHHILPGRDIECKHICTFICNVQLTRAYPAAPPRCTGQGRRAIVCLPPHLAGRIHEKFRPGWPGEPLMLVAGIDSSTQSTKVLLCRAEDGAVVGQATAPHPDGTEADPELWWRALLAAGAGLLDRAEAVGVAAQQHGMVALDSDGEVVRAALLRNDMRSAPQARALVDEIGPAEWARRTGSVPTMSFTVTKLRWLAEREPANAARTAAVVLPHDWLSWRLRGGVGERTRAAGKPRAREGPDREAELVTDRGDASGTGYFATAEGTWLPEMAEAALGHPVRLPRVARPGEAVGETGRGAVAPAGTGDNRGAAPGPGGGAGEGGVSTGRRRVPGPAGRLGGPAGERWSRPAPGTTWAPRSGSGWTPARWWSRSAPRAPRTRSRPPRSPTRRARWPASRTPPAASFRWWPRSTPPGCSRSPHACSAPTPTACRAWRSPRRRGPAAWSCCRTSTGSGRRTGRAPPACCAA